MLGDSSMDKKQYKFLDLSGYMFSGKAAAIDLIREFEGYHVPYYHDEFPLIRIQDGIMDLEKALIDDWSPIRSDVAIKRFIKLITKLSNKGRKISFKEEELVGWGYDDIFGNKFYEYSMEYAESLIDLKTRAPWPFAEMTQSFYELVIKLLLPRVKGWRAKLLRAALLPVGWIPGMVFPKYAKDFRNMMASITDPLITARTHGNNKSGYALIDWPEVDLIIASGACFYEKTKIYLERILSIPVKENEVHTIVFHNGFEPFNPWRPLRYFNDAKCIVVDRDPRDIYVTACTYSEGYNDNPNVYGKIAFSFDVELFIKRCEILRRKTNMAQDPEGKVLRLRFEELVMDYEGILNRIYEFLGESKETHINKLQFFNPSLSCKNVGIWKNYSQQDEIEKIYDALKPCCYDA